MTRKKGKVDSILYPNIIYSPQIKIKEYMYRPRVGWDEC